MRICAGFGAQELDLTQVLCTYFDTLMIFQQGSLWQSYSIRTPLYKQTKLYYVILLGPIQNIVDGGISVIWIRESPSEPF